MTESQAGEQQSLGEEHAREIQNLKEAITAKMQKKVQDLHHSCNKAIMEKENQQLKLQLKEATLKMKRKEQTIEKLEEQLKQMQLKLPRIDLQQWANDWKIQMQLKLPRIDLQQSNERDIDIKLL